MECDQILLPQETHAVRHELRCVHVCGTVISEVQAKFLFAGTEPLTSVVRARAQASECPAQL